jgi:hypothetical protein
MNFKVLVLTIFLFASLNINAGEWLYGKVPLRPEVRDGSQISVILSNSVPHQGTGNLCPANRVFFTKDKWVIQNGVEQYLSLLLTAYSLKQKVSIHVEI